MSAARLPLRAAAGIVSSSVQSVVARASAASGVLARSAGAARGASSTSPSGGAPAGAPAGSKAERIIQALKMGQYDAKVHAEVTASMKLSASGPAEEGLDGEFGADGPGPNPYLSRVAYPERYATSEGNPAKHTFAHVGRYYSLGDDAAVASLFPGGLPGGIKEGEFDMTYTNALQVRPQGVALVAQLEHWRQTHGRRLATAGSPVLDIDASAAYAPPQLHIPATRASVVMGGAATPAVANPHAEAFHPVRVVVGPSGVGKSGVLAYALHYARSNGWLAVCIPDAHAIMHMGKVLVRSKRRPGMVDQHDVALSILQDLASSQAAVLRKLPQRGKYAAFRYLPRAQDEVVTAQREELRQKEEAEQAKLKAQADAMGKVWDAASYVSRYEDESDTAVDRTSFTLHDLVAWGLKHPSAATDTLLDLLAEVRLVTEVPVLVLVDGVNSLYAPSAYAIDEEALPASQLSVPAALMPLNENGFDSTRFSLKRGLWLLGVSFKHHQNMDATLFGQARVAGRVRLPVAPLSRLEMYAMLRHYKACGAITEETEDGGVQASHRFMMLADDVLPSVDAFSVEYYRTLTGGRPAEVQRAILFTPEPTDTDSLAKMKRRREARRRQKSG